MSSDRAGETLGALQPDAVQAWLLARGWRDDGAEGEAARACVKDGGKAGDEVLLPTRPTAPDYRKIMGFLVEKVAQVEGMTTEAVLNDLSAAGYDVLRVRMFTAEDGALDLSRALTVVQQSRGALAAAARAAAAKAPRRSYVGRQAESVTQFLDQVRLGQTERGSYVLPLLVPYAFDPSEEPVMAEWFGRRVMRKLATALQGVDSALSRLAVSDPTTPFAEAAAQGVSADLCQSLGKLLNEAGDVEFSIRWAVAQPDREMPPTVRFSASSAAALLRAAHELNEQDPPPPEPIVGVVTKLDDVKNRAIIEGLIGNQWRNIEFAVEDRFRSVLAKAWHDRRPVSVQGQLKRDGRRLAFESISRVEMLPEDDGA